MLVDLEDPEEMRDPPLARGSGTGEMGHLLNDDQLMEEQIARERTVCKRFLYAGLVFALLGLLMVVAGLRKERWVAPAGSLS